MAGHRLFSQPAWLVRLRKLSRRLWVRASLFCLLAIGTALFAILLGPYVPDDLAISIGGEAVDNLLSILASSMLAVTTFSLSTMVAAYASASQAASPRASTLLIEDRYAQTALSTFIGAFLFSVVGVIALSSEFYGAQGRVVMFVVTILVLATVVVTLIRWIDSLSRLGRVRETIERVEEAARAALIDRAEAPHFGAASYRAPPDAAIALVPSRVGYVQSMNVAALAEAAQQHGLEIYIEAEPGTFVDRNRALARVAGALDEDIVHKLRGAFVIDDSRSFDSDMRFGMVVLSEIGQRALSAAVNDPGTAIDVIGVQVRLLTLWQERRAGAAPEIMCERVYARAPDAREVLEDAFARLARDGAAFVEIGIWLQKAFAALAALGDEDLAAAARHQSSSQIERARAALSIPSEIAALEALAIEPPTAR